MIFFYAPPSGYFALCTDNLPNPDIDPNKGETPDEYFNTRLYQGNSGTQSITGVGFQPDLLWVKNGAAAYSLAVSRCGAWRDEIVSMTRQPLKELPHHVPRQRRIFLCSLSTRQVRFRKIGAVRIMSRGTGRAGGAAVNAPTAASPATCRAALKVGFSIVGYTGTGSAATVGHGLNEKPQMIFVKNRGTGGREWLVYNRSVRPTKYMFVTQNAASSDSSSWNNTEPTSSVFTVGSSASSNNLNEGHVAYCFHSVEGYSKIGSYEGNADADGAFVYTGFKPAWVLFKRIDSSSASWVILDNKRDVDNPVEHILFHTNAVELSPYDRCDFVSNGFKLRDTGSGVNNSDTILYMAFAEQPFKYANAR